MYEIRERANMLATAFDIPAFVMEENKIEPVRTGGISAQLLSAIHFLMSSTLVVGTQLNPPFYTHLIKYQGTNGITTLNVTEITKYGVTSVIFGPVYIEQVSRHKLIESLLCLPLARFTLETATAAAATIPQKDAAFVDAWAHVAFNFFEQPKLVHRNIHTITSSGNYYAQDGMISVEEGRMLESDIYASFVFEREMTQLVMLGDKDGLRKLVRAHKAHLGEINLRGTSTSSDTSTQQKLRSQKNRLIGMNTKFRLSVEKAGLTPLFTYTISEEINRRIEKAQGKEALDVVFENIIDMYCDALQNMMLQNHSVNIVKVKRYIINHMDRKITLDELCSEVNLAPAYLCRLFKKESHMTMGQYILMVKMNEAKWLLESTDKSIMDVALAIGMSDQSHFAQVFSKYTGLTPTTYRKHNTSFR